MSRQSGTTRYTPAVTLWAFLSQVLFADKHRSCLAAVARVVALMAALGRKPCSENSGAYCRARAKIPTAVIRRLTGDVAEQAERRVPKEWLWCGRRIELLDGFTVSGPDTIENQKDYPQPSTQAAGLGFPLMRCVIRLSLATGMAMDLEIGPYSGKETGETALLRQMLNRLVRGTVLVADRYYCSYFLIALLMELGIDFVVRLHQCRTADFRRGDRLGPGDHIVEWTRPPHVVFSAKHRHQEGAVHEFDAHGIVEASELMIGQFSIPGMINAAVFAAPRSWMAPFAFQQAAPMVANCDSQKGTCRRVTSPVHRGGECTPAAWR